MTTVHQAHEQAPPKVNWPRKYDLLGVQLSATTYDEATEVIVCAARHRQPSIVSLTAVHAVVTASCDAKLKEKMNRFEMVGPDGMPVRWALNWLYGLGLPDRVCGPEMTLRICRRAAEERLPIYLYGGTPHVLESLTTNLQETYSGLIIAGGESPPFRPLTEDEDRAMVQRVNDSGASIMFIGLGCPKQDHFAWEHRSCINAVQVCVGAAFDFHAGVKKIAPVWMQRSGTEWMFRLSQEPRRLWRRYLVTNTLFLTKLSRQMIVRRLRRNGKQAPAASAVN